MMQDYVSPTWLWLFHRSLEHENSIICVHLNFYMSNFKFNYTEGIKCIINIIVQDSDDWATVASSIRFFLVSRFHVKIIVRNMCLAEQVAVVTKLLKVY